jgi:hypothetical protein
MHKESRSILLLIIKKPDERFTEKYKTKKPRLQNTGLIVRLRFTIPDLFITGRTLVQVFFITFQ